MSSQQFHFIATDPTRPLARQDRRLVSSHAHKTSYWQKKNIPVNDPPPVGASKPSSLSSWTNGDKENYMQHAGTDSSTWRESSRQLSSSEASFIYGSELGDGRSPISSFTRDSPQKGLANELLDPFYVTSVPLTSEMGQLLRHYFVVMAPPPRVEHYREPWDQLCPVISIWAKSTVGSASVPPYLISLLGSMLVGGPAMIYGICGLAAAHQHSMRGRLNSGYVECESDIELLDILYYKGKILSELQRCLVGEVMCEPSGLVAAVGLIAMEILCGNKEELRLHMQGLEALLRVRGGWLDVPANVSYVWLVSTYIAAVWTNSVPPSAPSLSPELLIHTEELKRRKAPAISKDMMSNYTKVGASLDPELQKLIVSVRDLIIYREICHAQPEPLSAEQTEQITALRLNVEYRIMFRLFSHAPYIPGDPSDKIQTTRSQKAVLASLLIFSLTSMMILKHSSAPIRNLAKVLKTNLPSMDSTPSAIFPPALEIILWTLFLGAHITLDSDDDGGGSRGWYISRINRVAELLGLRRWETVKSALERCFYVERIYGVSFRGIWNGVLLEREKVLKGLV